MDKLTVALEKLTAAQEELLVVEEGMYLRAFLRNCREQGRRPSPDEVLEVAHSDETLPVGTILKAAAERAPYCRPKLAVVAQGQMSGRDFASLMDRAILRSERVRPRALPPPMKTVSPTPETVSDAAMRRGFAPLRRRPI
jgi:hypothetical protein